MTPKRKWIARLETGWQIAFASLIGAALLCTQLTAQKAQVSDKEVKPILERCLQCHGPNVQMSGLDLRTRAGILKGGEKGPAIIPGNADGSLLYRKVAGLEKPMMPMPPVPALKSDEIAILKEWIDEGAKWTDAETANPVAATAYSGSAYKEKQFTNQDRSWWAFQKPVRYTPPSVSDNRWKQNPIDAFVAKTRDSKGLEAAPQADKRALIRRAYLDLWGLLPPVAEVEAFVKDTDPDAYKKLVDRLLESPHYGERWGRFWLDVVRYAETSGFEYDRDIPNAWRYRDYVIKAFNEDKPYNLFIVEQLAGDELDNPTKDSLIATSYYRVGPRVRYREKQNPGNRYDYMDDMIRTTFQGFMGLSVNCARCHDHKFDPITRMDYYRSMGMFWGYVDYDQPLVSKAEVEAYEKAKKAVEQELAPLRAEVARIERPYVDKDRERKAEEELKKYPEDIQIAVRTPEAQRTPGQRLLVSQLELAGPDPDVPPDPVRGRRPGPRIKVSEADDAKRAVLLEKIQALEKRLPLPLPMAAGVRDGDYWLTPDEFGDAALRGNGRFTYDKKCCFVPQPGQKYEAPSLYFTANGADFDADAKNPLVQPGFLSVLVNGSQPPTAHPPDRPDYRDQTSGRRRALGEWIASQDNPLTARVMVNRIWGWHFGTAIVATPGNFGKMGIPPSDPQLLDWLATEFVRQGWSVKQMHRLIMNSETYKMASSFYRAENMEKDATDTYLWKFPMHRVEGELVHDLILSASGQINFQFGGEPFAGPIPHSYRLRARGCEGSGGPACCGAWVDVDGFSR